MLLARRAVLVTAVIFVALILLAMRTYPGGTSWDHDAPGHHFWLNFLCDLARPTALNGVPNPIGSALAQVAMTALALGLLPFWWMLGRLSPASRIARVVPILGAFAVAGIVAVVMLPGDRFGALHGIAVVTAAIPGLSAAVLAVVALVRVPRAPVVRAVAWLGAVTLAASGACFALYLPDVLHICSAVTAVAVLERASLGLLLLWMLVCCAACRTS